MDNNQIKEIVKKTFVEYLTANNCRITPERIAVLDSVYSEPKHFDMDSLYESMNKGNFKVSRATLYNTMQLLLECNLVIKHQFGFKLSIYEIAYNNDFHHHLVCTNCNSVGEYKNPEIKNLIQSKKIRFFTPSRYSLSIFGICNKCAKTIKQKQKQQLKNKKANEK